MNEYLKKADENLRPLHEMIVIPKPEDCTLLTGESITLDLGNHYVGYFAFNLGWVTYYFDAPVKLRVKFCEGARELEDDFSAHTGFLSSWLQEEIIHLDFPGRVEMPRRYACRYIQITALFAPHALRLSDFSFRAVTSADVAQLIPLKNTDARLAEIDRVAVNTLKNCMQRVFEDGPKRDRRLWIGDLRLEALTNYYTFRNMELVKRCLYLFAATQRNENGFVASYLFEYPEFVSGFDHIIDYALLYAVTACDYLNHSGDKETFLDLYPVVKQQVEAAHAILDSEGIISRQKGWFAFIDWCPGLECIVSLHGVYLYTLDILAGTIAELFPEDAGLFRKWLEEGRAAARREFLKNGRISSPRDKDQYSVHSAVWMTLGGVLTAEEARIALPAALSAPDSKKPVTPYMYHYTIEALLKSGMKTEAFDLLRTFWGGMIDQGADTFYEIHVPGDPDFTPYVHRMTNSLCHAWSCTPSYFIRQGGAN